MGKVPVLTGINGRRSEMSQACAAILRERAVWAVRLRA